MTLVEVDVRNSLTLIGRIQECGGSSTIGPSTRPGNLELARNIGTFRCSKRYSDTSAGHERSAFRRRKAASTTVHVTGFTPGRVPKLLQKSKKEFDQRGI